MFPTPAKWLFYEWLDWTALIGGGTLVWFYNPDSDQIECIIY